MASSPPPNPNANIVVIGNYSTGAGGTLAFKSFSSMPLSSWEESPKTVGDDDGPPSTDIIVKVQCQSANQAKCEAAAKILVTTRSEVYNELVKKTEDKDIVVIGNRRTSINEYKNTYSITTWVVSDKKEYDNNGRGTSWRDPDGMENIDTIYYGLLVDDGTHSGTYATPEQRRALVLHELAHLTEIGKLFFDESYEYYKGLPSKCKPGKFYEARMLSDNIESFTNDIMAGAAAEFGWGNFGGFRPGNYSGTIEPKEAYDATIVECNKQ